MPVAVGIDLGTTHSCVAVWRNNQVDIIPNELGNRTTPSCVSFSNNERLIGDVAKYQAAVNPRNTVFDVKRLIGRKFDDPKVQADIRRFPFKVFSNNGKPYVQVDYRGETRKFSPEEISSMILLKLKETAETYVGHPVTAAVVTCPATFSYSQRQATRDAGTIAGLRVLRLIDEPTTAALAYGLGKPISSERNVVIFDLGGGSLDVSLLTIEQDIFEVKATAGDTHLGGEDFDNRLITHFAQEFKRKTSKDLTSCPRALRRLHDACERVKRILSSTTQAFIEVDSLFDGIDFNSSVTRAHFEDLCQDLFCKILLPVGEVLRDSRIRKSDVHEIVMIGGSTRIPRIEKLVSDFFDGMRLNKSVNPDEAVANGAAIQAAVLSGNTSARLQNILLLDTVSLSLGIETAGGFMFAFLKRNASIPTKKCEIFAVQASSDHQLGVLARHDMREHERVQDIQSPPIVSRVFIKVYEGEQFWAKDNTLLGKFELPVPPTPAGTLAIEVSFDIDGNGALYVSATEKTSGQSKRITISGIDCLRKEEIEHMIKMAGEDKAWDERIATRVQAKNGLESYAYSLRHCIADVEAAVNNTLSWLDDSQDASQQEYESKQKELEAVANTVVHKLRSAAGARGFPGGA
ncbi:heat shock cognate 70 [Phlebopus sp. FC_14]|nr:heat shock cognate 70 [Phlebopus sp. FC_14]